tara:strand:+ start:1390 stop:1761 length:372 start_codon:yes stop_codon:yes gene_type:complete
MKNSEIKASIQFTKGIDISVKPTVKVTRNKDGRSGKAIINFKIEDTIGKEYLNSITQIIMKDNEGELITNKLNIRQMNKNKKSIDATYTWKEDSKFKRLMRFLENFYNSSETNSTKDLGGLIN